MDLHAARREYQKSSLDEKLLPDSPFSLFINWLEQAEQAGIPDFNAALLATVSAANQPSCRAVLIKEIEERSLLFYTHTTSRKGQELAHNPHAAVTFLWTLLERQLQIEGEVTQLERTQVEAYWKKRPRESKLSSYISKQDAQLASKEELILQYNAAKKYFEGKEIPLPKSWGGYRLVAHRIEFWQGGPHRLHDRIVYLWEPQNKKWEKLRLSP